MIVKRETAFILIFLLLQSCYAELDSSDQAAAAFDVIHRMIQDEADNFQVTVDFTLPKNTFKITTHEKVHILASSGVAAVRGFYDYLRHVQNAQVAWEGSQLEIDFVNTDYQYEKTADSEIIFFQNVCTFGYSYVWWTFEDWRKHIDWIAMHGINLVLAPFQEDVWRELYKNWGMTDDEIHEHFSGPAFFPWQRMGNFRGFGGPLSDNFIKYASQLQQKVVYEYQRLGIKFALPSFAGHVPVAFKRIFPNTKFQTTSCWMGFPEKFCCLLFLDPTDKLFSTIGTQFLTKMIEKYGTSNIYFADPFNELTPPSNHPEYLKNVSSAIYDVMTTVDPKATWLLQGWMFYNEADFWEQRQMEAFLTAVPIGKMLVLDLHSDQYPQYHRTRSYYNQPFIWCMLHNFGGSIGNHGAVSVIAERAKAAFNNDSLTMVGVGITPEGINQNHVMYEFTMDVAWQGKDGFDTKNWFMKYGKHRYGKKWKLDAEVWRTLHDTVYDYKGLKKTGGMSPSLVVDNPSLNIYPWSYYHPKNITSVVQELLSYKSSNLGKLYEYDVVDFTRQFLQNMIDLQYIAIIDGCNSNSLPHVKNHSDLFLNMISDMDRLLKTNDNFLLGKWIDAARFLGGDFEEKKILEYNARNQITLWGPYGEITNYGIKQWSGLISDYVYPRWKLCFTELIKAMENGKTFNEGTVRDRIRKEIELPFSIDTKVYPDETNGTAVEVAEKILNQYKDVFIDQKWLDQYIDKN